MMHPLCLQLGPLMLDVAGPTLDAEDRELLSHPMVGGVLLFSRNYRDPDQLQSLTAEIKALRAPPLLIAVDHEGGRVQRFREGFTRLPAAASFERLGQRDPEAARDAAFAAAWLMATELGASGVDFSFAPVLDVERGLSRVIGDRAFGHDAETVANLAGAWVAGAAAGGMASCGKHFPGHGAVVADSHLETPVDHRTLAEIEAEDLVPFKALIAQGLAAVMPAHLRFPEVDDQPAGYSSFWLGAMLRERLGFKGLVFSDDLGMAGAALSLKDADPSGDRLEAEMGLMHDVEERALLALAAGCDQVLVCNDRIAAVRVAERLMQVPDDWRRDGDGAGLTERLAAMYWRAPAETVKKPLDRASATKRLMPLQAEQAFDAQSGAPDPTRAHLQH